MEFNQTTVSEVAGKLGMAPEVFTKFLLKETPDAEVTPLLTAVKGLELFTAEQLSQRISNERLAAATEASNTALGNTYGAMDSRILADTGVAKNQGEKTIDYMARAAKEKYGSKTDESAEMTRLRGEIVAKDQLLTQKDTELQQIQVTHATERKQGQINASLDAAINTLPINTTPELLDSQREFVKYRLGQAYDIDVVDGKVVFKTKGTEDVVRDTKTAAAMSAAALVEQFAPKVVSLKQPSATQPSGYKPGASTPGNPVDFTQYATKEEFAKDLAKRGVTAGSPEGGKLFADFLKARPELAT